MIRTFSLLAVLSFATSLGLSAPPDVPKSLTVGAGKVKEFTVKGDGGKDFGFKLVGAPAAFREVIGDVPGERVFWLIPETDGASYVVWWTIGEKGSATTKVNEGVVPSPPVPPVPPPPPVPPVPPPSPVTSFRVIVIYESGDTLTAAERGVVYGKVVEDWLTANCTSGKGGWRRRDKDAPGDADATMAGLWTAIQPKVTTTPCIAVERNSKVEIIPLAPTPAKMVEVLTTYRGK